MFNNYKGFHLVQSYHDLRHMRKYHPTNSLPNGLAFRT